MEHPEVFYTYEWALAVDRAYGASVRPLLLLGQEGDSLVGVVALATDTDERKTFFLAGTTADYCDFVCDPRRRPEFIGAVFTELQKLNLSMLVLANLPMDSATSGALRAAARSHGYSSFSRPAYLCAQIVLGTSAERETLKESVTRRKALRYALKCLGKQGPVTIHHLKSWDRLQPALPQFIKAHISRFLATGRASNLASPERQSFLTELAKLQSDAGWLVLTCLLVGERPVAWNYGFQFSGSWFYYQPTFDSDLQQFSPGFCLLSKIVEDACDNPQIKLVDLGLGAEGYKERFATAGRQTLHVTVTTSTARRLRETVRYYGATAVKSAPRLEHWVRRLMRRGPSGIAQI
jgi:CelD/BcsL family acetyltransferase involved in cellulose biosynthesis